MNLRDWNKHQIQESKSELNRYYFWLKYQRQPKSDEELLLFYIENGGARDWNRNHNEEMP